MNNKKLILILAALAAGWYFFIRKDPATGKPTGLPFLTPRPTAGNNIVQLPGTNASVPGNQARTLNGIAKSGGTGGGNGIDGGFGIKIDPVAAAKGLYGLVKSGYNWLTSGSTPTFEPSGPAPAGTGHDVFNNQSTAPVVLDDQPDDTGYDELNNQSTNGLSTSFGGFKLAKAPKVKLPKQNGGVRGPNHDKATARDLTRRIHGV